MKDIAIKLDITIGQAMKTLTQLGEKCLVIINKKNHVLGTLSDGDLRKAILKGAFLGDPIKNIYQQNPTILVKGIYLIDEAKKLFTKNKFDLIPVVDEEGKLVDILKWETVFKSGANEKKGDLNVSVIIMAGGKGTRMEPFTKVFPKPLVPVHEKPIIEHIIDHFTNFGCNDFHLTVNYKGLILKAYFEELQPDYRIHFIEEQKPLGTAGGLRLVQGHFRKPFFVTNCDIIIKTDYASLYDFHQKGDYDVTLVASAKEYIIPYGTCELNGEGDLYSFNEKPHYNFLINTGLYVMNPDMLDLIPENKFYHINQLIEDAMNKGKKIGVFPIDDDTWIDVGHWTEYERALERLGN